MKITYICNERPPASHGGIGTFVYSIAHGMKDAGHDVSIVGWGEKPDERDDDGVRVVTLPQCNIRGAAWWVNRRRVWRWIKQQAGAGNIDIVETPEFQGPLIWDLGETPVIVRLHLSATAIAKHAQKEIHGLNRFCEKRTLSIFPLWIAVSDYALELTKETFGVTPRKSITVYNPVSPPGDASPDLPFLPWRYVLYAGSAVSRRKGAYLLADAAREFLRLHPDTHLVYVGPVECEKGISADRRIQDIVGPDLYKRVFFAGWLSRDALLACMSRAAVFVYPSTLETFGLVTAEAMRQGCPVVVCDTGPCPEFVENEKTGLLAPPHNVDALSQAVNRLLNDRELAQRLAEAGKNLISSRFTLEHCVIETISFYKEILENHVGSYRNIA